MTKKRLLTLILCIMGGICTMSAFALIKSEVKQSMRRVADWQIVITTELFMVISTG